MSRDPGLPVFATLRDGDGMIHLECRFLNGEKYAAVEIDESCEQLAAFILGAINADRR